MIFIKPVPSVHSKSFVYIALQTKLSSSNCPRQNHWDPQNQFVTVLAVSDDYIFLRSRLSFVWVWRISEEHHYLKINIKGPSRNNSRPPSFYLFQIGSTSEKIGARHEFWWLLQYARQDDYAMSAHSTLVFFVSLVLKQLILIFSNCRLLDNIDWRWW